MRVAANDLALTSAIAQAKAEAEAAFGCGDLYLEKFVEHPRHVEVQVIADLHGKRRSSVGARLLDSSDATRSSLKKAPHHGFPRKPATQCAKRPFAL